MLIDTFCDDLGLLTAQGWDFHSVQRYDPTIVTGTMPDGRAFSFSVVGKQVELAVTGGRTVKRTRQVLEWEADKIIAALNDAVARL